LFFALSASAQTNYAISFDGVDDHIEIPHVVSRDFTVEFWMKTSSTGPAGAMQLYINGKLEASSTGSTNARTAPTRIIMGELQTNINRYNGSIDEVRIWNTVRTKAEIIANMFNKNLSDDANKMNEGSGTTATNSCTNTFGIDGTLTNGPAWTASPIQFGGNALHFDQADDRVMAPLATSANSNVTIEEWIYHEGGTGADHLLVSKGVVGTNGYAMYINTQRKLCILFNAVGVWNTNYVITSNIWTHIALVISTTDFTVYANEVNVYSGTATPIIPTGNFILGYNTVVNGQPFDGKMDKVRVWNTARTQTEIQNNMNGEIDP
jgi:hypothetical protein